ncbi:MAG TPA: hypothetical protein EYN54_10195 [Methylococcaceae bacterium]|nr:hypothetical protein [Methylococcaceae bacterium]
MMETIEEINKAYEIERELIEKEFESKIKRNNAIIFICDVPLLICTLAFSFNVTTYILKVM